MSTGLRQIGHPVLRSASPWLVLMIRASAGMLKAESGGALVEMALCIPLLGAPLLIGTVETGIVIYESIEVSNAAHAGAAYGMMSSTFAADSAGMTAAAKGEAGDGSNILSVAPTTFYACSQSIGGTHYTTQSAANSACTGTSNHSLQFVQVNTSASIPIPFRVPGLPTSFNLTATSVMEVEE